MSAESRLVNEYMRVNDALCKQIQEDNLRLFFNPRDSVSQKSMTLQNELVALRFRYRNEFPTPRVDQICPLLVKDRSTVKQSFFNYSCSNKAN